MNPDDLLVQSEGRGTDRNGAFLVRFAWISHAVPSISVGFPSISLDFPVVCQLGRTYSLEKMTLKSPSEHTVQGAHHAMELQLHHGTRGLFEVENHGDFMCFRSFLDVFSRFRSYL